MCSSSQDDALACRALLQLKLQALSSGLGCGERDRHARFTHPSPATSCCRKGWWRAASAANGKGLQALNSSLFLPNLLQLPSHSPSNPSSSSLPFHSRQDKALAKNSLHHPSGAEGSQQHPACPWHVPTKSFCRNTLVQLETQHCSLQEICSLPAPPLRLLSHQQGWKEDAPSAKGTPGWPRAPCSSPRL